SRLLLDVPLFPRHDAVRRARRGPLVLFFAPRVSYAARGRDCAARAGHALPGLARALRPAQANRSLDPSPVALRLRHRRNCLLDALSPLWIAAVLFAAALEVKESCGWRRRRFFYVCGCSAGRRPAVAVPSHLRCIIRGE